MKKYSVWVSGVILAFVFVLYVPSQNICPRTFCWNLEEEPSYSSDESEERLASVSVSVER